eukprot:NODE_13380_length_1169_cov_3.951056.p1 GENE.NODE_13380_length_1169_cov_3.951056~~NODE_13380_length_1169_cov_3.951056.p1  ORF type:complete len:285 (+),score=52.82 NODE_13380_length_1169_cov_3.951056:71-856(+)
MCSFCLLAALFANVARSLCNRDVHTQVFQSRMARLKQADHQQGLNPRTRKRIADHYRFIWGCSQPAGYDVLQESGLTPDLRKVLAFDLYGRFLRSVPFLATVDEQFLKSLCSLVELEGFSREDHIINAGETGTDLYFIIVGCVQIVSSDETHALHRLMEGNFFGEFGLLMPDSPRLATVIAQTHGWLLVLSRVSLCAIASPELIDKFRSVALERYQRTVDVVGDFGGRMSLRSDPQGLARSALSSIVSSPSAMSHATAISQ